MRAVNEVEQLAIIDAMQKELRNRADKLKARIQHKAEESGASRYDAVAGGCKATVSIEGGGGGPKAYPAPNEPFLAFLREQGYTETVERPREGWEDMCDYGPQGRVVWHGTGEVVPGAWWDRRLPRVVVRNRDRAAFLRAARDEGLLDAPELNLIGGDDE